jgi:hypothetical protein
MIESYGFATAARQIAGKRAPTGIASSDAFDFAVLAR